MKHSWGSTSSNCSKQGNCRNCHSSSSCKLIKYMLDLEPEKPNLLKFQRILPPPFFFLFSLVRKSKYVKTQTSKGLLSQTWRNTQHLLSLPSLLFFLKGNILSLIIWVWQWQSKHSASLRIYPESRQYASQNTSAEILTLKDASYNMRLLNLVITAVKVSN